MAGGRGGAVATAVGVEGGPIAFGPRRSPGTVTSGAALARSPHSAAAIRWLATASRPQARTAAYRRPSVESSGCPTA